MSPAALLLLMTAPQISAEESIEMQRVQLRAITRLGCPPEAGDEDIVVCGRGSGAGSTQGYRVPYVSEPGRRLPGEMPSGMDALGADRCLSACQGAAMISLQSIVRALRRGIERIAHPD